MNKNKIDNLINDLKQLKDELTVKANLGMAEAQDELKKLEPAFDELKEKVEKIADVAGDSASELKAAAELGIDAKSSDEVDTALELAAEELKSAYGKIKNIVS
jgi:archaellum component FlaC